MFCPMGTSTPLLVRTLRRTRRHIFNGLFTGEEVSKWSTTIVVMAAFDSAQLASLRSLTEVFGSMCLIPAVATRERKRLEPRTSAVYVLSSLQLLLDAFEGPF